MLTTPVDRLLIAITMFVPELSKETSHCGVPDKYEDVLVVVHARLPVGMT